MNDVEIIYDESGLTALWACQNLGDYSPLSEDFFTFAFRRKGKIIGALVFSGYRPDHDVWWTIYTTDRHWCTPKVLKTAFTAAFDDLNCRRINLLVSRGNAKSLSLVQRLGFKEEGVLRAFRENGQDAHIFGMLKSECNFLRRK